MQGKVDSHRAGSGRLCPLSRCLPHLAFGPDRPSPGHPFDPRRFDAWSTDIDLAPSKSITSPSSRVSVVRRASPGGGSETPFSISWGGRGFPSYWGLDGRGGLFELVTNFGLLHEPVSEQVELSLPLQHFGAPRRRADAGRRPVSPLPWYVAADATTLLVDPARARLDPRLRGRRDLVDRHGRIDRGIQRADFRRAHRRADDRDRCTDRDDDARPDHHDDHHDAGRRIVE